MKKGVNLEELTNSELFAEHKKRKRYFITWIVLFTVLSLVTVYNNFVDGTSSVFSFFPVLWIPLLIINGKSYKAAQAEVQKRNLTI
jgi:hypothetical protein